MMRWWPRSSKKFWMDIRWFAIGACAVSISRWKTLFIRLEENGTLEPKSKDVAMDLPHQSTYSSSLYENSTAIFHTASNITSNLTTIWNDTQGKVDNDAEFKFFILAPPEVTSWLIMNHTEKASLYYKSSLNEESAEIWLHRGFEKMTYQDGHTMSPQEADVIFIAGYLHLRYAIITKADGKRKAKDKPDHSFVLSYRSHIQYPSKPHLLLIPTWNPGVSRNVGIKSLARALQEMNVNLWSVGFERSRMWQGVPPERILPVPYVVHPSVTRDVFRSVQSQPRTPNFVFFVGDQRPNAKIWAGCHRDKLILPLQNETQMYVRLVSKTHRLNQSEYNHRMATSDFCLIVCGDTPSSRSLTSAVVSGCIPIRVGSRLRGLCEPPCTRGFGWEPTGADNPHLPFPDQIPWGSFPEVDEAKFMENGRLALENLFHRYNEEKKMEIRLTLQKVQLGWIYGWGDPVTSNEFGEAAPFIWRSFATTLQSKLLAAPLGHL